MYLVITRSGIFLAEKFKVVKDGRKKRYVFFGVRKRNGVFLLKLETHGKFVKRIISVKDFHFSRTINYINPNLSP